MDFDGAYLGKTVLVTGHTGFQGSWLCEWLLALGAKVIGLSLDVPTTPSNFEALSLGPRISVDARGDIRALEIVSKTIGLYKPDIIFHLAAQPLVRRSFVEPHRTVETNVIGTLNVLEAVRQLAAPSIVILATTDKVYENMDSIAAFRESDSLGGYDPYSASKAAAEHVISSYRRCFFSFNVEPHIYVASVRGGNAIGGGDWAEDRLIPNSIRRLQTGEPLLVRNPTATRPWQHVLELLSGYLLLGSAIFTAVSHGNRERVVQLCSSYNFGPHLISNRTVQQVVDEILSLWPGTVRHEPGEDIYKEAGKLNLAIDKAYHVLGWAPRWSFREAVRRTVEWYRLYYGCCSNDHAKVLRLTRQQIAEYSVTSIV